ncbi:hypothetical protein [Helicobacter typhlonius]|uniref:Uncharacterized protein n=1 Tax=Helicobacter typhlonius TaxID=76936 RepID=A0A0S4PU00_9HELI|nr:hypothetical protein [Helicobacter typhlonius]CUU39222.1 Hypothetical protein BN2458_PEG0335 [Helicobacter typhlonius]
MSLLLDNGGGGIHTISLAPNGNVEDSHLPTLSIIIPYFMNLAPLHIF